MRYYRVYMEVINRASSSWDEMILWCSVEMDGTHCTMDLKGMRSWALHRATFSHPRGGELGTSPGFPGSCEAGHNSKRNWRPWQIDATIQQKE